MQFVTRGAVCALVMPTRNRCARLQATLTRLAATPGPAVEVIVVDNASTDGTTAMLAEQYPNVRAIELNENTGATGRNIGAQAAQAPFLFMLDDDSGPYPGTLEEAIDALRDPKLGVVACQVVLPDGSREEGGSRSAFIGCGAVLRRQDLLSFGGYHPEYTCYVEEYDVSYRFLALGLAVRYLDECLVWHEPTARDSYDFMVEKLLSNNGYLAAKFYPTEEAVRFVSWITYRYSVFAQQKGAATGFRRGMEQLPEKILRGLADRFPLTESVMDLIMPERETAPTFAALKRQGAQRIAFLRAGKELPGMIQAARDAGLQVEAILELPDGLMAKIERLFDTPVIPAAEVFPTFDAVVIGGTSPGFVHNTLAHAQRLGIANVVAP